MPKGIEHLITHHERKEVNFTKNVLTSTTEGREGGGKGITKRHVIQ